jgi:hypothetical protein
MGPGAAQIGHRPPRFLAEKVDEGWQGFLFDKLMTDLRAGLIR